MTSAVQIVTPASDLTSWHKLKGHYQHVKDIDMRDLFATEPNRFSRYSSEAAGIFLDFSKNRITDKTLELLWALATERGLAGWIDRMFCGEPINLTEKRAVLHTALRNRSQKPVYPAR